MKKLLSLIVLLLCAIGTAWATGDVFTVKFQSSSQITQSTANYFTYNKGEGVAVSWSSKGKHSCTYGEETYSDVIKMESATQAYFTSTAEATVTIVQTISNGTGDKLKFDGTNLNSSMANTTVTVNSDNKYNEYVITKVAAGKHTITRQSETGLAYIKVEYTGTVKTKLTTPEFTINKTTGEVSIGNVTNATKITYTTDGSDPTAESATYSSSFMVEDGTIVKAIAITDNDNYTNSDIAEEAVYLTGITVATPVITTINGTLSISCATKGATIKFSTDGTNYSDFSKHITLFDNTTIYAKAVREGATDSEVASKEIMPAPAAAASSLTKILGFVTPGDNNWEYMTSGTVNYGIKGKTGTEEDGWSLWISANNSDSFDKGISGDASANSTYTINAESYQYIKSSNGRQFNIGIPSGYKANRLTVYSFNNGNFNGTSLWSNVAGTTYTAETEVPLQSKAGNNPDVRVFSLDNIENSITLTNNGIIQQCFILVIDYTTSAPSIAATPGNVDVTIEKGNTSANASFTITGSNLTNGTYDISASKVVEGLSFSPAQFTVTDGIANQLVTVTYEATESNEGGSVNLTTTVDGKDLSVPVNYVSKAKGQLLEAVSAATTWDWSSWSEELQLKDDGTTNPKRSEQMLYSEIIENNSLSAPSGFATTKIAFKGEYPVRSKKAQNGTWTIKTTVAGNLSIKFSDTGKSGTAIKRFININGRNTKHYVARTGSSNDDKTVTVYVPAGEIVITGMGEDGVTPQAFCLYTMTFTPVESMPTTSVTIGETGYKTFASSYPLDFSTPISGLTAYKASVSGDVVSFEEINGLVPAGEGMLLKGNKGNYPLNVAATMPSAIDNVFEGMLLETTGVPAGIFVLMDDDKGIGFYRTTNAFTVGANTAYLPATAAPARSFIGFDEATAIKAVESVKAENAVFNLRGQRVKNLTKGLYIVNGKKVVK